jgi:enoyl-[acyl-carrier protein] reductase I
VRARNSHAITYLNDKAKPHVEPLAREVEAPLFFACDVTTAGHLEAIFSAIKYKWGRLDFVCDSIAWARKEDLHGRLTDCSTGGFAEAVAYLNNSGHSRQHLFHTII